MGRRVGDDDGWTMKGICPQCNRELRLGTHWAKSSDCNHPEYNHKQNEFVKGLLMGDGYLRNKDKSKNPYFVVAVINEDFLHWLDTKFGVLTHGVSIKSTVEQIEDRAERISFGNGREGTYHDVYQLRFRSHPHFHNFTSWYDSGSKQFPKDIELTPEAVKMWYVCDGGLKWSTSWPSVEFYTKNELNNIEHWVERFQSLGFKCRASSEGFTIPHSELNGFFEWLGDAPDGFEYKWQHQDREEYDKLKSEIYYNEK